MSATTEAIELVDELVKAKIPKHTATKLIDFAEKQRGDLATKQDVEAVKKDVNWLKWIIGIGFTIGFGLCITVILYLHSDTKSEMNRRFEQIDKRFEQMDKRFEQIEKLLQK